MTSERASGAVRAEDDLVSVVIPTRNRRELLMRAINSVHNQTHQHWELIIVDDASDDDTIAHVSTLCRHDPRIKLISNERCRGGGYSRHVGAAHTHGKFVAFLDSDDYWFPRKLERQLRAAHSAGDDYVVVVGPMAIEVGEKLVRVKQTPLRLTQRITDYLYCGTGAALQASSLLVSGALARRVTFDPHLSVNQDTDYLLRLERADAKFIYVAEALHVQDVKPRRDRVSLNKELIEQSLIWFKSNPYHWTPASRRGFYLSDTAIRVARSGDRIRALKYFFMGLSISTGCYYAVRQFVRVLCRGELPGVVSKAWIAFRWSLVIKHPQMAFVLTNCLLI